MEDDALAAAMRYRIEALESLLFGRVCCKCLLFVPVLLCYFFISFYSSAQSLVFN